MIKLAYDELDKFHWQEEDLMAYEERIMNLQKEEAILEYRLDLAKEEGIQIGEEKGEMKAKIAVAKSSLKAGVSIDVIAEITGLPVDEIKKLQKEIASNPCDLLG